MLFKLKYILILSLLGLFISCSKPQDAVLQIKPHLLFSAIGVPPQEGNSSCSATQIKYRDHFYILTARHCVEERKDEFSSREIMYVTLILHDNSTVKVSGSKFVISQNADVAVLPLLAPILDNSLDLSKNDAKLDDKITITGYPLGVSDQITRSGLAKSMTISWYESVAQLIQIMAAPGDSGSSILNKNEDVVGILVAGDERGPMIAYMVPVSLIKAFLISIEG
jgi:V8-like Glu-specific endopeptidase